MATEHNGRVFSNWKVAVPLAAVLGLAAWGIYAYTSPDAPKTLPVEASPEAVIDGYHMICRKCNGRFEVKRTEFSTWPQGAGGFQCPKCKAYDSIPDNSKAAKMPAGGGG